jgi:hypothetical protein
MVSKPCGQAEAGYLTRGADRMVTHLREQHIDEHGAASADEASGGDHGKIVGDRGREAPANHQRHAEDRDALVAEILAEQAARVRNRDPGKQIEPDQQSEPRVIDLEIGHDERGQRSHRLELEAHRGSRQEQNREDQPSLAAVYANTVDGTHRCSPACKPSRMLRNGLRLHPGRARRRARGSVPKAIKA